MWDVYDDDMIHFNCIQKYMMMMTWQIYLKNILQFQCFQISMHDDNATGWYNIPAII